MLTKFTQSFRKAMIYSVISTFSLSMLAFGQDPSVDPAQNPPPPSAPGWRRFSPPDTPTTQSSPPPAPQYGYNPQYNAPPQQYNGPPQQQYGPPSQYGPGPQQPYNPPPQANALPVPDHITLNAGTFITVRVDQLLSSDKNQPGDGFSASLARPLVADGFIVSRRGEPLGGRVVDAKKAGRVKGVSHLQIALNTLTLADGHAIPVETELTSITGQHSNGRDAGAILTTTATGAAIGAVADLGVGAAIGAGAGLIAGTVGVLVTRGRPTVIYPESQLTFRLSRSVTFSTEKAPQAFLDARTLNAPQSATLQTRPQGPPPPGYQGGPYYGSPYAYPPPAYYAPPYPYYWGPSFGFYWGPGFYGRGYFFRR
jgi:hypothetical protein